MFKWAMATPPSWAQDVIICDLCEEAAQRFCNNCQSSLCLDCVGKHVHKMESLSHDIVSFKNRKIRLVFPECEFHLSHRCEIHCQQCRIPICVMCFIGAHKGHDAVELAEIIELKKQMIKKEIEDTETNLLPKYQTKDSDLEAEIHKVRAEFSKIKEDMERLRKVWHQEVDDIFEKADEVINSMENKRISSLTTLRTKIQSKIPEIRKTVKYQTDILRSNDAVKINNFKSTIKEDKDIPENFAVQFPSLIENTDQGKELKMEIGSLRAIMKQTSIPSKADVASIHSMKELLDKTRVVTTIPTDYTPLWRVVCVEAGWAWISGQCKTITRVDMTGSIRDTVTITDDWPNDIAMTRQGELIFSENSSRSVKIVRHGRIKTLITTPQGWEPWGMCSTSSGDTLVNVFNGKRNKILRYEGQHLTQETDKDEHGNPIFTEGEFVLGVAENKNGDMCVSDRNAATVVGIDRTGRVRFRYDGTPISKKGSLNLGCIVTDSLSQIIVTDFNNGCLHILDQNGEFLRRVDNRKLLKPVGLSIDTDDRLWVGLHGTGEIKVIQYLK